MTNLLRPEVPLESGIFAGADPLEPPEGTPSPCNGIGAASVIDLPGRAPVAKPPERGDEAQGWPSATGRSRGPSPWRVRRGMPAPPVRAESRGASMLICAPEVSSSIGPGCIDHGLAPTPSRALDHSSGAAKGVRTAPRVGGACRTRRRSGGGCGCRCETCAPEATTSNVSPEGPVRTSRVGTDGCATPPPRGWGVPASPMNIRRPCSRGK
mmetsp:Transcript_84613/g.244553  ORF Transcript_84613/g.244553 Transcript_84613/m.244553 type:complete len:211 (-) Transcript_84613:23-655(-)